MVKQAMEENGNIAASFVKEQAAAATIQATALVRQQMAAMEERLTARIGASATHHHYSSGTHGNNTSTSSPESRSGAHLYPSYKYQILMQRNGTRYIF